MAVKDELSLGTDIEIQAVTTKSSEVSLSDNNGIGVSHRYRLNHGGRKNIEIPSLGPSHCHEPSPFEYLFLKTSLSSPHSFSSLPDIASKEPRDSQAS